MPSTFSLAVPSIGAASKTVQTRVLRADFGDGYEQRAVDGLNNIKESWQLSFNNISNTLANSIIAFFEGLNGVTPFYWTGPNESVAKLYICGTWNKNPVINGITSVTATFEQVFDLV